LRSELRALGADCSLLACRMEPLIPSAVYGESGSRPSGVSCTRNTMRTPVGATPVDAPGYPDMLPTHRVRVVARLSSDVQRLGCSDASHPSDPRDGTLEWDTSAVYWERSERFRGPVFGTNLGQTLTVVYEAEGRDASEAARFARAIFEWEWKRTALPAPVVLAVVPDEATVT
jgi:hypothetical protein